MDQSLKHKKLVFEFSITGNATPASKTSTSDLPGILVLRTEGLTAEADAVEALLSTGFTTPDDESAGDCTFGVMLKGSQLGSIGKVLKIAVSETSTSVATSMAITKHGTGGLSTGGNITFSIVGTGLRLDTESPKICVEVDYVVTE